MEGKDWKPLKTLQIVILDSGCIFGAKDFLSRYEPLDCFVFLNHEADIIFKSCTKHYPINSSRTIILRVHWLPSSIIFWEPPLFYFRPLSPDFPLLSFLFAILLLNGGGKQKNLSMYIISRIRGPLKSWDSLHLSLPLSRVLSQVDCLKIVLKCW